MLLKLVMRVRPYTIATFNALTLLVGQQEGHPAYEKSCSRIPKSSLLEARPNLE